MSRPAVPLAHKGSAEICDHERFGLKAAGLASVPQQWTPPFFALAVGTANRIFDDESLRDRLNAALEALGPCGDGVIVRSSARDEALARRGALDSSRCSAAAEDVALAVDLITERERHADRMGLGFLVQAWVPGAANGHLSNERRVSRDRRSWLWEVELDLPASPDGRFRVDSLVDDRPDLACTSLGEVPRALRAVARVVTPQGGRSHLEWVWDGARLWILQRDREQTSEGRPPGADWPRESAAPLDRPLRLFTAAASVTSGFPKAEHVRVFSEAGLPSGDVRILSGSRILARLAVGQISRGLEQDLRRLIEAPVVVRTDSRASTEQPVVLSRRTDTCTTYDELRDFLVNTARELVTAGTEPGSLAFLVHRFVLAEVGAFGFASPGSSRVVVDATWGIPDSLLFHPHDSFRIDVEAGRVERYLRCKTDYIDVDADGGWRSRPAGAPWDWRPALSNASALKVAKVCARVADHVGVDVEVMFFIGPSATEPWVLPWFYKESARAFADIEASRGYYVGERVVIRQTSDLRALEERLTAAPSTRLTLNLRPTIELLRSREFILAVAAAARRWSTPIELEGSQLSHAYYLLDDAGAFVRCVNPWQRPERRQPFGKLVRDLVPVRIERHGEHATTYSAERSELAALIPVKIIEEALEYYWAHGTAARVEELADLLELLHAAARVLGMPFADIEDAARVKREERGGFENGVVLVETRDILAGSQGEEAWRGPDRSLLPDEHPSRQRRPSLTNRRVLRLPGRRLVLPAAPPAGFELNEPHTVALDAHEEAVVVYGATGVQLQVRPRERGPGRNQLELFGAE